MRREILVVLRIRSMSPSSPGTWAVFSDLFLRPFELTSYPPRQGLTPQFHVYLIGEKAKYLTMLCFRSNVFSEAGRSRNARPRVGNVGEEWKMLLGA